MHGLACYCRIHFVLCRSDAYLESTLQTYFCGDRTPLLPCCCQVIVGHVNACLRHIIVHTCFVRQLKDFEYMVKNSRSKHLHESIASYVILMLQSWPPSAVDKEVGYLESMVEVKVLRVRLDMLSEVVPRPSSRITAVEP